MPSHNEHARQPLATPPVTRRRTWLPSMIWLIPLIAALVGITLVARILLERGPEIVLSFKTAEGLEAGKTAVKYKDVQIGMVQSLRLASDRSHVQVTVHLNKDAEAFTAQDTRYWVVRPRLDTSGISGLGTLLSGAYIGADAGVDATRATEFTGHEVRPSVTSDASGQQYLMRASNIGSLDVGSPVYYRRIKVGQVVAYELDDDGRGVTLRVFINTPYAKFVGTNTRFWHASGLDMQINASGLTLRTQSLATILLGGIAFGAPEDEMGSAAPENTAFTLAGDEAFAMKQADGTVQNIGEVKSVGAEFDRDERAFRMPVMIQIYPDRLRRQGAETQKDSPSQQQALTKFMIGKGLRAQLRTGNLLTGQLYVAIDFFPNLTTAKVDYKKSPLELPTVPGSLNELQSQVQDIAAKINKLPLEQIAANLLTTMAALNKTLVGAEQLTQTLNNEVSPEISAVMKDARKTIRSAEQTLAQDSPLQQDMRQTLQELTRAASSIRTLTDYLERQPDALLRGKPDDRK
jgi:paraquat-inducible protein B